MYHYIAIMGYALLRARGGISASYSSNSGYPISSPRTRRYFPWHLGLVRVGSTLLRARGGISAPLTAMKVQGFSSPRTRRYFRKTDATVPQ